MMRMKMAAALLAACSICGLPAQAQVPHAQAQLAPGEVPLEVDGFGRVRTPATLATVTATARGAGMSDAEARQKVDAEVARMTAAARAAGAAAADIRVARGGAGEVGLRTFTVMEAPPAEGDDAPQPTHYSESTVTVRLRDASRAQELNLVLNGADASSISHPVYELTDDSAARRSARAQAIANARADAESYAAALNMRIVRMVRVTERAGFDFFGLAMTEGAGMMGRFEGRPNAASEGMVETMALVGVDYVLAPR